MTYYMKSGIRFNVTTKEAMDLHETLPAGTYTVKFDKMNSCFYLEEIENLTATGKIYGDAQKRAHRIMATFNDREKSTGVLLTGEKGSGKTLLARLLAQNGRQLGIPSIVINQPWCGEEFNAFVQMIEQPTIILFDEFEKVYDRDDQEKMLTLLDGVYPSKKLFVLTCNDRWRINEHMRNRPGRIYYMLDYRGLDREFIEEYCRDNLDAQEHIPSVCRVAGAFGEFNFDMLKAMVEEMNRFDESPIEVMKMLNTRPEFSGDQEYNISLQVQGIDIPQELADRVWQGNPMAGSIQVEYRHKDDNGTLEWTAASFNPHDLKEVDSQSSRFIFHNDQGNRLVLSRVYRKGYDWNAF